MKTALPQGAIPYDLKVVRANQAEAQGLPERQFGGTFNKFDRNFDFEGNRINNGDDFRGND